MIHIRHRHTFMDLLTWADVHWVHRCKDRRSLVHQVVWVEGSWVWRPQGHRGRHHQVLWAHRLLLSPPRQESPEARGGARVQVHLRA